MKDTKDEWVVEVDLGNGVVLRGPQSELASLLGKVRLGPYYSSESRGLIPIKTMASEHIKNALLKKYREWLESLRHIDSINAFVRAINAGPWEGSDAMGDLLYELENWRAHERFSRGKNYRGRT